MSWINVKDKLPEEGKYVLARHNRGTWNDETDQANVNCVVVKFVKGISVEERKLMKEGKLPSSKKTLGSYNKELDKIIYSDIDRWKIYKKEDQDGNNLMPYYWDTFGPDSFFGQTITHWMPIEPLDTSS
ncbi:Domain of unknown function DUF551 [uncultured Caudovirales phage]|uniref:Uncharacterized protein n=1 Tax=uncultured Caudovirales phage TaxID=2100421 RepID=A0A6J7X9C6_9CAUD|nr:Domain of unknown function DUF551 [uncultured Caudovirales phage]